MTKVGIYLNINLGASVLLIIYQRLCRPFGQVLLYSQSINLGKMCHNCHPILQFYIL